MSSCVLISPIPSPRSTPHTSSSSSTSSTNCGHTAIIAMHTQNVTSCSSALSKIGKDDLLKTVSDLTETIRRMIEAGISVLPTATKEAVGFTFKISELLNSENRDFALFLNEFNYIKNRGIVCEDEYLYLNGMVTITYWIGIPSLSVVCTDINNLNEYLHSEDKSDFAKDEFESSFKSSLMTQNNSLEDEIKFYS